MELKEGDYIDHLFITTTHHYMLFFTNKGKVYRLKVHQLPRMGRAAGGVKRAAGGARAVAVGAPGVAATALEPCPPISIAAISCACW